MRKILSFILLSFISLEAQGINLELAKNAKSAILMEFHTGEVVYEKNSNQMLPPASMTKIMTMLIAMDEIKEGNLKITDMVTASDKSKNQEGSKIFLESGEKMSVEDLFKAVWIASANDAAMALAEHISGTEEAFVARMNEKAKSLGLKNTSFKNPTGLTAPNHYSSAYDMAIMARCILINYKETVLKYSKTYEDYLRKDTDKPFWLVNTNKLIRKDGIDGLKTGWTNESGYCLTATMEKNDLRFISVVMGYESANNRNQESFELLNYGISNYELNVLRKKNEEEIYIDDFRLKENGMHVILEDDLSILVKKSNKPKEISYKVILDELYSDRKIKGKIEAYCDKTFCGKTNLVVEEPILMKSYFEMLFDILKMVFI